MSVPPAGRREESGRLLRRVLFLRFATVVAILAAGLLVYTRPEDRGSLAPWVFLFAATSLFTLASHAALRRGGGSRAIVVAQLTADLAVAAAAVHLSGGYDSPFTFLYVLSVMSGAALLDGWGALIMGSAASSIYALLAVLERAGRIVPPGTPDGGPVEPTAPFLMTVLIQVVFFHASAAGEHIEKIYLAGGSSKVPGLVEALRQEFSLPVEILNPFQRIAPPADGVGTELIEQNAGQLAVAVGLALRSFEDL